VLIDLSKIGIVGKISVDRRNVVTVDYKGTGVGVEHYTLTDESIVKLIKDMVAGNLSGV
jgi:hypothetical protein